MIPKVFMVIYPSISFQNIVEEFSFKLDIEDWMKGGWQEKKGQRSISGVVVKIPFPL